MEKSNNYPRKIEIASPNDRNSIKTFKYRNMKKLILIISIIMMCSCANRSTKQNDSEINTIDLHAEAVKKLQDTTITSVYLGLRLGMAKDSTVNLLNDLQQGDKIKELRAVSLDDDSDYKCTGLSYHGDSYKFSSKINVFVDSTFYAFDTYCTVDFYKGKLYSVVIKTYPYDSYKVKSETGWAEIRNMFEKNYGIGFTSDSTYEFDRASGPEIWEYSSRIENCMSFTTENTRWTASNIQVILANKKAKYKVDEYDEQSFKRLYKKYEWDFGNNTRGLAYRLESEARLVKSYYKERDNYLIIYKDVALHDEIVRQQQIALEEEARLKAQKQREKEIADSIRQEQIKKEYTNQAI